MLHGHKTNEPCSLRHELPSPRGTEVWRADTEREGTKCGKRDVSRDPGSKGLGGAGDKVMSDTVKHYLQYHRHEEKTPTQLRFDF